MPALVRNLVAQLIDIRIDLLGWHATGSSREIQQWIFALDPLEYPQRPVLVPHHLDHAALVPVPAGLPRIDFSEQIANGEPPSSSYALHALP